jgi:hypothetical protein
MPPKPNSAEKIMWSTPDRSANNIKLKS